MVSQPECLVRGSIACDSQDICATEHCLSFCRSVFLRSSCLQVLALALSPQAVASYNTEYFHSNVRKNA